MSRHIRLWNYDEFKSFMDGMSLKSDLDLAHELNRSKGSIFAMRGIYKMYHRNHDDVNLSGRMKSYFEKYYHFNGNSHQAQSEVLTDVNSEIKMENQFGELDKLINQLKDKISDVIVASVEDKLAKEREATAKEMKELKQFKETVRNDSIAVTLMKKLNHIV